MKTVQRLRLAGGFAIAVLGLVAFMGSAWAAGVAGQGTWETTLQARDLNGDGSADAYYDTRLNITWLDNYHDPQWSFLDARGLILVNALDNRVQPNSFWGVDGWHSPTGIAEGSQLRVLWLEELANDQGANTGPFQFITDRWNFAWTADLMRVHIVYGPTVGPYAVPDPEGTDFVTGIVSSQGATPQLYIQGVRYNLIPVHDGDVGVALVPEPSTYALMAFGLLALLWRRHTAAPPAP